MSLSAAEYLDSIRTESVRFVDVLTACDPATPVPSCPEWTAADLLWHLVEVQAFWARVARDRPARPKGPREGTSGSERPVDYDGLLTAFRNAAQDLADALDGIDPAATAWTWRRPDDTVAFILRRQAHEALIHRIDAELTADASSTVDPRLAADGVAECLDVMYGGQPDWGSWQPGGDYVRLDCSDTKDGVWLRLGRFAGIDPKTGDRVDEEDFHVVADPGQQPAAVVTGAAADLDRWLWHRSDDSTLELTGDPAVLGRVLAVLRQPIN